MFVISFNICLFIYFSVKYAIQSNDCDVFVNKQSTYLSIYLSKYFLIFNFLSYALHTDRRLACNREDNTFFREKLIDRLTENIAD